jgi:hypothetical protein
MRIERSEPTPSPSLREGRWGDGENGKLREGENERMRN